MKNYIILGLFCLVLYTTLELSVAKQENKALHELTIALMQQLQLEQQKYCEIENEKNHILSFWNRIGEIESGNNKSSIGDSGKSRGSLQIQRGAVLDVNKHYKRNFKHLDVHNDSTAILIGSMYLNSGIERYENKFNKPPSEKRIVQMWNFGIYQEPYDNGYYKKYLKIN